MNCSSGGGRHIGHTDSDLGSRFLLLSFFWNYCFNALDSLYDIEFRHVLGMNIFPDLVYNQLCNYPHVKETRNKFNTSNAE